MQFRLRTLLIVLALGPPVLAGGWYVSRIIVERLAREESLQLPPPPQIPVGAPAGVSGPHVIPEDQAMADLDLPFKLESFSNDAPAGSFPLFPDHLPDHP